MKLKAQSSKIKTSSKAQAQNTVGGYGPDVLSSELLLSFELWSLSFTHT
jgi:hypothetical protein